MLLLSRKPKFPGGKSPNLLGSSQRKKRGRALFPRESEKLFLAGEKIWPSVLNFSMQPNFKCLIELKLKTEARKIEEERSNDRSP